MVRGKALLGSASLSWGLALLTSGCGSGTNSTGAGGSGGGSAGSPGNGGSSAAGASGGAGQGGHLGAAAGTAGSSDTTGGGGHAGTAGAAGAGAAAILYAVAYPHTFGTLSPQTGAFTQIATQQNGLTGGDLAMSPAGVLYGMDTNRNLVVINPSSATSTVVGPLSVNTGNGLDAFKFREDGVLFGASFTDLYTVDPSTAQTTHVGAFGVTPDPSGLESIDLAIDASGHVFFTANVGETAPGTNGPTGGTSTIYSVDTTSGTATRIGAIGYTVEATEFSGGTLYGFTNASQIVTIDTTTGAGTPVVSSETPAGIKVFAAAPTTGLGGGGAAGASGGSTGGSAGAAGAGGGGGAGTGGAGGSGNCPNSCASLLQHSCIASTEASTCTGMCSTSASASVTTFENCVTAATDCTAGSACYTAF